MREIIHLHSAVSRAGASVSILLLFLSACTGPRSVQTTTTDLTDRIREEYSGRKALETVAFLDQFVRWPGNRGFNASIDHIAEQLERAGFVEESASSTEERLVHRVEEYPMGDAAWEPLGASVYIEGDSVPVLQFSENRNMLATNSFATTGDGVSAELVYVGNGSSTELDSVEVRGKIVMADGSLSRLFRTAVTERGALGALAYAMPDYLQPEKNTDSIQFRSVPRDSTAKSWGIALSFQARERLLRALAQGRVVLKVVTDVEWTTNAVERTVVAEIRGSQLPQERFVFSAHVQEPGANDNASGVGAQVEMARVAALMHKSGEIDPERSITFLWGQEIRSTDRYIRQDSARALGIKWGVSLDMVGEDTEKTGGTFLIEKMPDPSAIWTRGDEKHTEWGGRPLGKEDMTPHYFNDLMLHQALNQATTNEWVVKTNPYEGGSDHVPFLRAAIPGLLLWHFTDQFYHTDRDRLEMVSSDELENVGVTALSTALMLASADTEFATKLVGIVRDAAIDRLKTETELSRKAVSDGAVLSEETEILETWADWYDGALSRIEDVEVGAISEITRDAIEMARMAVREKLKAGLLSIGG